MGIRRRLPTVGGWPDRAQRGNIRTTHRNADTRMRFIMPIREWRTLRTDDVLTKRSTEQPRPTERADVPWLSNAGLSAAALEPSAAVGAPGRQAASSSPSQPPKRAPAMLNAGTDDATHSLLSMRATLP